MSTDPSATYSERFDRAVALAVNDFRPVRRKQGAIPYVTHLFAVTALVGEYGGDEDQLIAAMLHDWLEDIEGANPSILEAEFGSRVRTMVEALSDVVAEHPKPPWRERKEAFLEHIRTESPDVKLVCAADKLHNVTTLRRWIRTSGITVLNRFTGGPERTLWYYASVARALAEGWSHPLLDELDAAVRGLHADAQKPDDSSV